MISIGMLIGSIIGFKFGGPLGGLFMAYVGYQAENWFMETLLGKPSRKTRTQQSYFEALFTSIGKLAKADGIITKDEIRKCEIIIQKMQLNSSQRNLAIKFFNKGKQDGFDINPVIANFRINSGRSFSIKQIFLETLLEVAAADNRVNQAELSLLLNISEQLRFPQQLFVALMRMRGFNINNGQYQSSRGQQQRQQQWTQPHQSKSNPYQLLGVQSTDTKVVIRRAYKKLMSQHHPDKLIAKGLPPEMIEIAKTKTQNIQAAWEEIKDLRGF